MTWAGGTVPNWDASGGPATQGAALASRKYSPRLRFGTDECAAYPRHVCRYATGPPGAAAQPARKLGELLGARTPAHPMCRVQQNARTGHASSRGGRLILMAVGDKKLCLEDCAVITRTPLCGHPVSICPNPIIPGGGVQRMHGGECSGPRSVALWHGHEKRREGARIRWG